MMYGWNQWGQGMMYGFPWYGALAIGMAVWSLFWKGIALWKSARSGEKYWFIALLVINTFGLLEILYLFLFTKGTKGISDVIGSGKNSAAPVKHSRARKSK